MKKLQLCCGGNRLDGFDNFDSDVDVTKSLPFFDGSYDFIFIEHGAEHVGSHEFLRLCDECFRVLKSNGILRLCMPVLDRLPAAHARDIILNHGHLATYSTGLIHLVMRVVGFVDIRNTPRYPIDSHWRVIGKQKDDLETARVEGRKP